MTKRYTIAALILAVAVPHLLFAGWGDSGCTFGTNNEKIDAATDGLIQIVADDDAATLLTFNLLSTNGYANIADNDKIVIGLCVAYNDAPELITNALIEAAIVDASDGTEDGSITFKVQQAGTMTTALVLDSNGMAGENGETQDNATDAQWRITFDDDATTLGTLLLESDNPTNSMADNDKFVIGASAFPTASVGRIQFAGVDFVFTDVTSNNVDGAVDLKAYVNGTNRTVIRAAAATTIGSGYETIALDSSDWDISTAGVMTGIDEITLDSKYVAVGPNATNALMIQKGVATNGQPLVTFAHAFGAAPEVSFYWKNTDVSTLVNITNAAISSFNITATSAVPRTAVAVADMTNMGWIAIGNRP